MKLNIPTKKDVFQKVVLVRVDFNVPLSSTDSGKVKIEDDQKIRDGLETIKFLQKNEAKVLLMSHLGRPDGKVNKKYSFEPVAEYLSESLGIKTKFVTDCVGEEVEKAVAEMEFGEVALLENTRFHPEEQKNDAQFAKLMSAPADVFINDGFPSVHRNHASTLGVTQYLPSFAGFHLAKEVDVFEKLMSNPDHPFIVIVGGAKISDKIAAIENLLKVADGVLVGGGVANNFLKAEGLEIHKSYLQDVPADLKKKNIDFVKLANNLIDGTKTEKMVVNGYFPLPKIIYPIDVVAAKNADSTETQVIDLTNGMENTPNDEDLMYLDIGPKTAQLYSEIIKQVKTVFWNGPMGVFEKKQFSDGTKKVGQALAESGAHVTVGGGDTIDAIRTFNLTDKYDYVSGAGGATLAFLTGKKLEAIEALKVKN